MAVYIKDGALLVMAGTAIATDAACCCEPPTCDDILQKIYMVIGETTYPGAEPCADCELPFLEYPNLGPQYWDWHSSIDGWDFEIYYKPGFPGSCDYFDPSTGPSDLYDYISVGSISDDGGYLRIERSSPDVCNENNHRCWAVRCTHRATDFVCWSGDQGTSDRNTCANCCAIVIEASAGDCFPFLESNCGVQTISASFTISIPIYDIDPDCDSVFPDTSAIQWWLYIGGIEVATGTGLTGGGSGESSCCCPTGDPCSTGMGPVDVVWCYGGVCCSGSY